MKKIKILIAGIAGASLGTEVIKCLSLNPQYELFGCDISSLAYGHTLDNLIETFLIDRTCYLESVLNICLKNGITYIIPGAEEPMVLFSTQIDSFKAQGITLVGNNQQVVGLCSVKSDLFDYLKTQGFAVPETLKVQDLNEIGHCSFPCVVKPSENSGGSSFVFLAKNKAELLNYCAYLLNNGLKPLIQEYLPHDNGEYTVGVLSSVNKKVMGTIALKRIFNSKLSISFKTQDHLISSGYSQGLIDQFETICSAASKLAVLIGSTGPINVQGRIKEGVFIPFEINPRFSASTYLRAMAGFNEIDFYIQHLEYGTENFNYKIKPGYYLRSFTETYLEKEIA